MPERESRLRARKGRGGAPDARGVLFFAQTAQREPETRRRKTQQAEGHPLFPSRPADSSAANPTVSARPRPMRNPEDQEEAEAADHRNRRELKGEEARGGREAGDGDRRAGAACSRASCIERAGTVGRRLVEAGLQLDRVVDDKTDQDRQGRDRGDRQRAAEETSRPKVSAAAARAIASGSSRKREWKTEQQSSAMTTIATAKRISSASFSAPVSPFDHDRGAGDRVSAACAERSRPAGSPLKEQAWRGVVS